MTSPRVIDNDRDEITVTLDGKEIRGWSYASEAERRTKMLAAREFCEGWYQASRRAAQPVVKALREAIEFADQDAQALTPVGKAMVDRWRAAIHTDLPNYAGWRSIDTAPEDCRVILAAAASTPPRWRGAVASSIRGKRGQALLREMLEAMDALPEKRLVASALEAEGQFCALGTVGQKRGVDMSKLDPEDYETVAARFGIATPLAQEIFYLNDEANYSATPEQRFERMRAWVVSNIKTVPASPSPVQEG